MWRILFFLACFQAAAEPYRLHLMTEPHSLDPQATAAMGGNYLFQNIYRGLYVYDSVRGLVKAGAKDCLRGRMSLTCHLNPKHLWSDGSKIKAADYVNAFNRLLDPASKSPQIELVQSLKRVVAVDDSTVRFEFAKEDPEFEFKLVNPALSPWPPTGILEREQSVKMLFSGPYIIDAWKPGHFVHAAANPHYELPANPGRPALEFPFIENDATALGLYEDGKLDFLRRLPSGEIPRFRDHKDFIRRPMARWDYLGFGPVLDNHPKLREALALSLDFASFQALFENKSPPGCPGLNPKLMDRTRCLKFDPARAKKLLAEEKNLPPLKFYFSRMGGDDLARMSEWIQGQWKKNLGLSVELNSEEQLVYLRHLRSDPPAIFMKGIGLDRPTCLAAMELFSGDQPENYIRYNDKGFDNLVQGLRSAKSDSARKLACRKAVEYLKDSYRLVAFGERYFFMLVSPKYGGWDLNELNQLDLANLH